MAKKNPNLIRAGDTALVCDAQQYIRCGYVLTPAIAAKQCVEKHEQKIIEFLDSLGISSNTYIKDFSNLFAEDANYRLNTEHHAVARFLQGLGYLYTNANNFGGKTRQIFTEPAPYLENATVRIHHVNTVMTGDYYPPGDGYDSYNGEYYSEPGGLKNQTSHRIAEVSIIKFAAGSISHPRPENHEHRQWDGLWIECSKLLKISEENKDVV